MDNTMDNIMSQDKDYLRFETLPVLPLRNIVPFPGLLMHFDVGRSYSIEAVNKAMEKNRELFLVAQRNPVIEEVEQIDLFSVGLMCKIRQVIRQPNGTVKIMVECLEKRKVISIRDAGGYLVAEVHKIKNIVVMNSRKEEAYRRKLLDLFYEVADIVNNVSSELMDKIDSCDNIENLSELLTSTLMVDFLIKQEILEDSDIDKKIIKVISLLNSEKEILNLEKEINEEVKANIDKSQRDYFLREQMKVIKKKLNDDKDFEDVAQELMDKLKKGKYPKAVFNKLEKEIRKLEGMPGNMSEASVLRNYIELLLELPWMEKTKEEIDLKKVEKALEKGHFALNEAKERILEYLAVRKLNKENKSPILCLVGPPGVGKTSLSSSIGPSINRKFARMSLGGVRDEAEIRGHRRTYVGALPGRIIQAINTAGTNNPVILLDEIDKLGSDYKGDPSSALLEVLDPEQNNTFTDHYVELPFDLSDVLFITTANSLRDIPGPLRDRMEIIELSSYTESEKISIANKYLIPKQIKANGLDKLKIKFSKKNIQEIINEYTRESGVRNLEREIGKVLRKIAVKYIEDGVEEFTSINVKEYLGVPKIHGSKLRKKSQVGIVNGLAVSGMGGDVLVIEGNKFEGSGKVSLTGMLGDVMKESFYAALSYLRSTGIIPNSLEEMKVDIHIHVPEGAVPKDGPSAGVAMTVMLYSLFTNKKIDCNVAMTGEVTMKGRVLPIGGLKEKVIAAYKESMKSVFIPIDNEADIALIPNEVKDKVQLILVSDVSDVISKVFV